ncbi:MAG: hypothetical protein K6F73_09430 [Lachnospiraceae bacterium]|nr:hypothetical protein [Lachnospiraceae bacterium]
MLGKLLKHDFIATWKVTVAIDALVIILGIMTAVVVQTIPHLEDSIGMSLFTFSFIGIFYIGIIAASIVTMIYLVVRYYRNLYTSEGYLTFTLPVKTDMIIHSKVITGSVWMLLNYFCVFLSVFIAGTSFLRTLKVSGEDMVEAVREIADFMGFADPGFIFVLALTAFITPIAAVLSLYFCVSIGQLWQGHKVLGAILCFIALYIANQMLAQVAFFGSGFWQMMTSSGADIDASFAHIYRNMMLILSILTMIESAVYYAVNIIISRTKLNLD